MAAQRLNIEFESLFPGDTLNIGDASVIIRPLGLLQLTTVVSKLRGLGGVLSERGVTWDNYNTPENMLIMAEVLLGQFPEVLAEASNVHQDDLSQLPLDCVVEVLDKVIEVNIRSREKLEKNFQSLAKKFGMIAPKTGK